MLDQRSPSLNIITFAALNLIIVKHVVHAMRIRTSPGRTSEITHEMCKSVLNISEQVYATTSAISYFVTYAEQKLTVISTTSREYLSIRNIEFLSAKPSGVSAPDSSIPTHRLPTNHNAPPHPHHQIFEPPTNSTLVTTYDNPTTTHLPRCRRK